MLAALPLLFEVTLPIYVHHAAGDKSVDPSNVEWSIPIPFPQTEGDTNLSANFGIKTGASTTILRYATLDPDHFVRFRANVSLKVLGTPTSATHPENPTNSVADQPHLLLKAGVVRCKSTTHLTTTTFPPPPPNTKIIIRTKGVTTGSRGTDYYVCVDAQEKTTVWNCPGQRPLDIYSKNANQTTISANQGMIFKADGAYVSTIARPPACVANANL